MRSGLINKHRSCLFLFISLSWQNHTDLVRAKDAQVKRKVLIWAFRFLLQVCLQVQATANEWKSMQCPVKGSHTERPVSESAAVKVTDHLLQHQQRSLGTNLLPCSLLQYHLLLSFCILLTRLLLHLSTFLLRRQR